jgi:hypothetical protein
MLARVLIGSAAGIALLGCGSDRTGAPPEPAQPASATVTSGGDQRAVAGEQLSDPILLKVTDRHGAPISGIGVDWYPQDSGTVEPAHSVTGWDGIASTMWTLGLRPGEHAIIANVAGYGQVTVHADAEPVPLVINAVHVLRLDTPDGSGQTTHPDFLNVSAPGPLQNNFLAITAYPFGDWHWENPSVYASVDRIHWSAPPGATNPVATPQYGFLSDPDIVFNPTTEELWLYYRQAHVINEVKLMKSRDGVAWTEPAVVANALNHLLVSPTVVRRSDTEWLMWSVNGQAGCVTPETWVELRRSSDGENWSAPERVSLEQPGFTPWHIDVQWIPTLGQYWAVYNVKTPESCSTPALYLATSTDGVTWTTYPSPVLARGEISELNDIVYRATFRYRPETDAITFWFSGARYNGFQYEWRSAVQRRWRSQTFEAIARPPLSAMLARMRKSVPPLLDPP